MQQPQQQCPHVPQCSPANNGPCWRAVQGMMGATALAGYNMATGNVGGFFAGTANAMNYAVQGAYDAYTAPGQPGAPGGYYQQGYQQPPMQQPPYGYPPPGPYQQPGYQQPPMQPAMPTRKGSCNSTQCEYFMKEVTLPHQHDFSCNQVSCNMFMKHGCPSHSFREVQN